MPQAYCTTCSADVTVRDGRCLLGHEVTGPIVKTRPGRHRAPSRWRVTYERLGQVGTIAEERAAAHLEQRRARHAEVPARVAVIAEVGGGTAPPRAGSAATALDPRPSATSPPAAPPRSPAGPPRRGENGAPETRPATRPKRTRLPVLKVLGLRRPEQDTEDGEGTAPVTTEPGTEAPEQTDALDAITILERPEHGTDAVSPPEYEADVDVVEEPADEPHPVVEDRQAPSGVKVIDLTWVEDVEELPVEEYRVDELPIQEQPVQAIPVEELPVEEYPVEEVDLPPTHPETRRGWFTLPTLAQMRHKSDSNDTGQLIGRLWEATEEHPAIQGADDFSADELDELETSSRGFRLIVILASVAVVVGAVMAVNAALNVPERQATSVRNDSIVVLDDAAAALTETRAAVVVIADPNAAADPLADTAVVLATLNASAREVFDHASGPLPDTPPGVSRDRLEALQPARGAMVALAEQMVAIEARLGDALSYRLALERVFALPDLPASATEAEILDLSEQLSVAIAGADSGVAELPADPIFAAHREGAVEMVDKLAEWHVDYIAALRDDDQTRAATLAFQMNRGVELLQVEIQTPLKGMAQWAGDALDEADTSLEQAATLLD